MELDKKEINIDVRDKTFRISFVSNWVVYQFEKMNQKLIKLQELYEKLESFPPKDEIKKLADEIKDMGSGLLDERLEIVKEVLESNDIEFDRKWWEKKTDGNDVARFLSFCVFKDAINSKKKAQGK